MKLNNFWFCTFMIIAISICCYCFQYTGMVRQSNAVGGEVFVIALPLLIIKWKLWTVEQKIQKKDQTIKELKKTLNKSLNNWYKGNN